MLTRRQFARGLALTAVGLLVPAPLVAAAEEPTRRLWALDGSMLGPGPRLVVAQDMDEAAQFADAAGKVIALLDRASKDFAVLLATEPWKVAEIIALDARETPRPPYTRTYRRRAA